jgi:hypothetical protein
MGRRPRFSTAMTGADRQRRNMERLRGAPIDASILNKSAQEKLAVLERLLRGRIEAEISDRVSCEVKRNPALSIGCKLVVRAVSQWIGHVGKCKALWLNRFAPLPIRDCKAGQSCTKAKHASDVKTRNYQAADGSGGDICVCPGAKALKACRHDFGRVFTPGGWAAVKTVLVRQHDQTLACEMEGGGMVSAVSGA